MLSLRLDTHSVYTDPHFVIQNFHNIKTIGGSSSIAIEYNGIDNFIMVRI